MREMFGGWNRFGGEETPPNARMITLSNDERILTGKAEESFPPF